MGIHVAVVISSNILLQRKEMKHCEFLIIKHQMETFIPDESASLRMFTFPLRDSKHNVFHNLKIVLDSTVSSRIIASA